MNDEYFELADKLLPLIFEHRQKQFSSVSILISIKDVDQKLLKQLLFDLETCDIIKQTESKTTIGKNIKLTALGLKIAPKIGSYREFISEQNYKMQERNISIKELHIGDKIEDSKIKNFKTNKSIVSNSEDHNTFWKFLSKFWWAIVIPIIIIIIGLIIENKWFK